MAPPGPDAILSPTSHIDSRATESQPSDLGRNEVWWSKHYEWLENCGYLLRPRYRPGWIPSWQGTVKSPYECEDWIQPLYATVLDATRISDGEFVMLKSIRRNDHPFEVEIARYFMSESLLLDPMNHCIPILDVLAVPNEERDIIVMPLLRRYSDPPFKTLGEVVDCLRQLFEGLHFMHKNHVAHRDCMNLNIMMDPKPLFVDSFHPFRVHRTRSLKSVPRHRSRTQCPTKYYLIDFGLSRRYDASVTDPVEPIIVGGDNTVPEFKSRNPQNPFPTDVYYIGHAIQQTFLDEYNGLEFVEPLVLEMIQENPSLRPTMDQAVSRLEILCQALSTWKLRTRLKAKKEGPFQTFLKDLAHWPRRLQYIIRRLPAVPCRRQ